ncbi:MAG: hypothetical protein A2033_11515 [Bacteroidetes bacterium GWA2_31_9]|nr:MAG: hypothetical protein A2033_11515 [Bacteroidetes bacterium GWA2_31_9]
MKFTEYFNFTRLRSDRCDIKMEWIEQAFNNPDFEEIQTDGRIRKWTFIKELNKYLRIVVLEDNQTIHNAFFDRSFKTKENKL